MRKLFAVFIFFSFSIVANYSYALLNLELTRGVAGAVPIAVVPFLVQNTNPPQDVSAVITNDLKVSGRFKVYNSADSSVDNVVTGKIQDLGGDQYQVSFQLLDAYKGKNASQQSVLLTKRFTVAGKDLRALSHHISDLIYQQITGVRGIFSTRLAYIVVQHGSPTKYALEVSDIDGYHPRVLLTSTDPIMSPAWSPNGRQIAYVSFENKHTAIFVQDVVTGGRRVVSEFPGINGAPAWSPDGKKLALVLSKDGTPNIYILDLNSRHLSQLTKDWSINTEPAWSPDGKNIIFTSNRSGGPQIYQKNLGTGTISRVTYDGNYNARGSFTRDGNHIVVLNKESNIYNIGILDLNSGIFRVLTSSGSDNESPSIAPNSSMVLYGTLLNDRNVLGLVATDGSVQLRMPARDGNVQDPAWSPFLS